jgi:hypothetical protein
MLQHFLVAVVQLELLLRGERFQILRVRARGARYEVDLIALSAGNGLDQSSAPPTEAHDTCVDHCAILRELIRARSHALAHAQ